MKSIFLKAIKVGALSLVVALGASDIVLANGAGAPPTTAVAHANGAGNGAGGAVKRKTKGRRVAKRKQGRRGRRTA